VTNDIKRWRDLRRQITRCADTKARAGLVLELCRLSEGMTPKQLAQMQSEHPDLFQEEPCQTISLK
jgi:hypothetical protein